MSDMVYTKNEDFLFHVTHAMVGNVIPGKQASYSDFKDGEKVTGMHVQVNEGDKVVWLIFTFGNHMLPLDLHERHRVHARIFGRTVRQVYRQLTTKKLEHFMIDLCDELLKFGWTVAVYPHTPNGIPLVQLYHQPSDASMVFFPATATAVKEAIDYVKQGDVGAYDAFLADVRGPSKQP